MILTTTHVLFLRMQAAVAKVAVAKVAVAKVAVAKACGFMPLDTGI